MTGSDTSCASEERWNGGTGQWRIGETEERRDGGTGPQRNGAAEVPGTRSVAIDHTLSGYYL